jgi:sRNA-binding carbon storage regulator CsrA
MDGTIIENLGNNRIGINAPKEYVISMEELLDKAHRYSTWQPDLPPFYVNRQVIT